ncbi:FtsL-like putative cell division protein [Leeuwenhoekiella sp. A16]|uniref:FtsL-like putative cell division protein n=1 Tax=unclassified Leeuwenhoekiella TaxID=2615029 RepID=UPI003A7FE7E1|tara:strand:- start:171165 stop:171482 length:318 start_codon:yes stop_codon:yes gene_type:complete
MKEGIYHILKGKFLISDDAIKNWRMIIFLSVLAIVMIASSHSADKKVHKISKLSSEVKELRSEFVDTRLAVRRLKMESAITRRISPQGIKPSQVPPKKIKVKTKE